MSTRMGNCEEQQASLSLQKYDFNNCQIPSFAPNKNFNIYHLFIYLNSKEMYMPFWNFF